MTTSQGPAHDSGHDRPESDRTQSQHQNGHTDGAGDDVQTVDPQFRSPYTAQDHQTLIGRAPHYVQLLDDIDAAVSASDGYRSLGAREALSGLKALEQARRHIERLSSDLLAHYHQIGDSSAHGYRTVDHLLEGELRIPSHEARRRTHLSGNLTDRLSSTGEPLEPKRPAIAQHFRDGALSADEARTLCKAIDDLPPSIHAAHADQIEKTLVELAPTVRPKDISKLSQRIIEHIDPDGKLPQYETNPMAYTVTLIQKPNGDWRLTGLLDSPTGSVFDSLLKGRMNDTDIPITLQPHPKHQTASSAGAGVDSNASAGAGVDSDVESGSNAGAAAHAGADADASADIGSVATVGGNADRADGATISAGCCDAAASMQPVPVDDHEDYCAAAATEEPAVRIPQVPLEVDWATWDLTVHADATISVNGKPGTFLEKEPHLYLDEDGWPAALSAAASGAVIELLAAARTSPHGSAHRVVREKILCRRPSSPHDLALTHEVTSDVMPEATLGPSEASGATLEAHQASPRDTAGVHEDGTRNTQSLSQAPPPPGLARHERLGFLLRCVSRQRVLHGADHALVVSATPEDLTHPHRTLTAHNGGPINLADLETWSSGAQTFAHIADDQGRTIGIRSHGRFATRTQVAVLAARDQGCTFPDCDAPPQWCEAHHIIPYALGGPTTTDNLTLVCPFHHRWFEMSGWTSHFRNGLPGWKPPRSVDPARPLLYHSRFRVALLDLPPTLPDTG